MRKESLFSRLWMDINIFLGTLICKAVKNHAWSTPQPVENYGNTTRQYCNRCYETKFVFDTETSKPMD